MFIDEKRSWISRSSELSEMPSISLNSEENKIGVRASYKHFAATRLFSRRLFPRLALHFGSLPGFRFASPQALCSRPLTPAIRVVSHLVAALADVTPRC